MSQFQARYFF